MAKPRKPTAAKATRAGKDMHSSDKATRREAAEVLALIPRSKSGTKGKN